MPGDRDERPDAALRQSPDVVSNRLGEGGVVVNLRTNRIFELNATGMRAWELIGERHALQEIARRLQDEFAGEPDRVRAELQQLLEDLAREGLIDAEPRT
jgi:Coenzyme PQQ synthesis protein D (PqqD)